MTSHLKNKAITFATVITVVLSCLLMTECSSRDRSLTEQAGTESVGGISINPSTLVFSNVDLGSSDARPVVITNTGRTNLVLSHASVAGGGFAIAGLSVPLMILPGRSTTFQVTFSPSSTNTEAGRVSVGSDTPTPAATLHLTGNGALAALAITDVAVSSISSSSARISWSTNQPADSHVELAPTVPGLLLPALGTVEVSRHNVLVTGLAADQLYHFRVKSQNQHGDVLSDDDIFLTTAPSWTTYYLDAINGNDADTGTSATTPWKTISKVNTSALNPGDHVMLKRGGIWREQLTIPTSGTEGKFIIFDAYGSGANPIIDAADLVTAWQNVSGSLWSAQVSWTPNQIFRNQVRMAKQMSQTSLVADNQWYFDGARTLYVFSSADPRSAVLEVSRRDNAVLVSDKDHIALNNIALKHCNSTAGCLLFNTSTNRSGFSVSNLDVASSYGPAVSFDNSKGAFDSITLNNLTSDHCAIIPGGTSSVAFGLGTGGPPFTNILMNGGHFAYSGVHGDPSVPTWDALGVHLDNVRDSQFIGGLYDHNGSSAFGVQNGSKNLVISGGAMHDDGGAPMGDANELDIGGLGRGSSNITFTGIDLYGSRNSLIEIASTASNEIMSGITITNCRLHNGLSHGFQIGGGHTNIVFKYNLVYQNVGNGLLTNEGTSGSPDVLIYNNVFWGNGSGGTNTGGVYVNSERIRLRNNIIGQSAGQEIVEAGYYALDSDYNLFFHTSGGPFLSIANFSSDLTGWAPHSAQDAHSVSADPLFVNPANNDYGLNSSSPAIHMGLNLGPAFKDALDPRTPFPYGTTMQDASGLGWNVGAFATF